MSNNTSKNRPDIDFNEIMILIMVLPNNGSNNGSENGSDNYSVIILQKIVLIFIFMK